MGWKSCFSLCVAAAAWAISASSALAQALPVYTVPVNRVGGAVASGITQTLMRRGFAANDPRILSTIEAVGARVIPLATAAGGGANWIAMASRLSPWITGGVLVYQGVKWYFNVDGSVTTQSLASAPNSNGVTQGGACFYLIGDSYCGGTPEEAVTAYILATTVYTDLTTITMTVEPTSTTAYSQGRRYHPVSIAGHRNNDQTVIWPNISTYSIYQSTAQVTCPAGYVARGTQCVPSLLSKYIPQPVTQASQAPQAAYDNLPQVAKDAALSPELASEVANRLWRDAALQTDYRGVPWSANDPVSSLDFGSHRVDHPSDWPLTSEINAPVPTTQTPVVSPYANPNQVTSPSTSVAVNLGPDPGTPAPMLEDAPTDLFRPIRDLLQPWLSWQVPSHTAQCPTWQVSPNVAGKVFAIDVSYHCTIAEQYRSMIIAAALACWIVIAAFVVLSA